MNNPEQERSKSSEGQSSKGSTPPDQGLTEMAREKKGKTRLKATPIQSVGQLSHAIYIGTFKRATLKKTELAAMRKAPVLGQAERGELANLALTDRILGRTRQLMLIGTGLQAPMVTGQIWDIAREVLHRHPAFKAGLFSDILNNLPEAATEEESVELLTSVNFAALTGPDGKKLLNKRESEQCKANAVHCLLLLFRSMRGTSVESIQKLLQTSLWAPAARKQKTEAQKVRVLIITRDSAAASITHSLLEKQVTMHSACEGAARRNLEHATVRVAQLEDQLASHDKELIITQAEVSRLENKLQEAIDSHQVYKAQAEDEFEQMRGRVLRRLNEELSLLDDGLHALQRDPPKVHVMLDHAERAIDGLKREMERLRARN